MKQIAKLSLVLLSMASPAAFAGPSYLGVNVGYFTSGHDVTASTHFGAVIAQKGTLSHLLEGEVLWTRDGVGSVSLDVIPFMVNYRLSAEITPKLAAEVGGGVGFSYNQLKYPGGNESDGAFAFQALGGFSFKLTQTSSLYAGIRYLDIGEASMAGITEDIGSDTSLEFGIRFGF